MQGINAEPLTSDKSVRDIYLSNITKDDSKGYTVGWNCFQVELAYDPDFSEGSLQIIPMSMTTSSIKFTGNFDSKTDGTIISTTTSNPLNGVVKGVASLVGAKAEDWVSDQVKKAKFGNKIIKVLSSGANSLVTSGVGAALGSFIGVFSKTTQTTQTVPKYCWFCGIRWRVENFANRIDCAFIYVYICEKCWAIRSLVPYKEACCSCKSLCGFRKAKY